MDRLRLYEKWLNHLEMPELKKCCRVNQWSIRSPSLHRSRSIDGQLENTWKNNGDHWKNRKNTAEELSNWQMETPMKRNFQIRKGPGGFWSARSANWSPIEKGLLSTKQPVNIDNKTTVVWPLILSCWEPGKIFRYHNVYDVLVVSGFWFWPTARNRWTLLLRGQNILPRNSILLGHFKAFRS